MEYLHEAFDALRMTYEAITHIAPHTPGKYGEEQGDEECVAASTQDGDMMAREESIDSSDSDEGLPTRVGKGSKQRPGSSASGFYSDM